MNNQIIVGVGGIIVGVIIMVLLNPTVRSGQMMFGWRNSANQTLNRGLGMATGIDRHFIEQMIPHHDGAIAMATLALTKATRPEIKTLAGAIIEAQNREIRDMSGWYKDWFKTEVSGGGSSMMGGGMMSGSGMHMGGQEDMQALEQASDFDKAFIEAMIPHHQLAVMMAQMLKAGTSRPEMLTLADNIIESQSKEIQEMRSWYKTWYQ